MSMKRSRIVAVVLITWPSIRAVDVHAQPVDPEIQAGELFDAGQQRKQAGDWPGACAAFEESQRLAPAIGTLFNLSECKLREGRLLDAAALLREAGAAASAVEDTARVARADANLAAIIALTPTIELAMTSRDRAVATATVDGVAVGDLAAPIRVDPGRHEIVVVVDGVERSRTTVTLSTGQRERILVDEVRDPIALPPVASARGRNWTVIGLGAGAVALAAVGTYLRVDAGALAQDAEDLCPSEFACPGTATEATALQDSARLRSQLAVGAFVGAGVVATAAAVFWWNHRRRGHVDIAAGPTGGAITYRASF